MFSQGFVTICPEPEPSCRELGGRSRMCNQSGRDTAESDMLLSDCAAKQQQNQGLVFFVRTFTDQKVIAKRKMPQQAPVLLSSVPLTATLMLNPHLNLLQLGSHFSGQPLNSCRSYGAPSWRRRSTRPGIRCTGAQQQTRRLEYKLLISPRL